MKIAYFDCFSGISGDMTLGALVDVGFEPDVLSGELSKLKLDGEFTLRFEQATKHGISGTRAIVETAEVQGGPVETDETEHAHEHGEPTAHHHHHHHHHHDESHHHTHEHGPSRHLSDIFDILDNSELDEIIVARAKQVFDRLAEAEAKVHDMPKAEVHLHEVSGIDSIVDIVASVIGVHQLGVKEIYASPLALGSGFVRCAHGLMPVPAPGTMELLTGVPVRQTDIRKELVTPTGAALITTFASGFGPMPEMVVERVGYGAGTRDLEAQPNLLRVCIGEKKTALSRTRSQ